MVLVVNNNSLSHFPFPLRAPTKFRSGPARPPSPKNSEHRREGLSLLPGVALMPTELFLCLVEEHSAATTERQLRDD